LKPLDYPNIVKIVDYSPEGAYIVYEYLKGPTLLERIISDKYQDDEKCLKRIFTEMVTSIKNIHKHFICHRDIKPENFVFVDEKYDSPIKLIDFGFSKQFSKITDEGTVRSI
jgi:serine/threonine protein kinase